MRTIESSIQEHVENINNDGYSIVRDVLSSEECHLISEKLDNLAYEDAKEIGIEKMGKHKDHGILRALMAKDEYFMNLILHPEIYPIVCALIGETAIVHLQNAIIVHPDKEHFQSYFHRDFQKEFTSSKLLSLNVFWMINDFNSKTGGTWLVPGSHKSGDWPKKNYLNEHAVQLNERGGSVLLFDSMLIHRGGKNVSNIIRRGVNHQYTKPFIKQQIDLPAFLGSQYDVDSKYGQVLGYWSIPPKSVNEFRCDPDRRTYRSGQG